MVMFYLFSLAIVIGMSLVVGSEASGNPIAARLTPVRLGWQTTWATQGQITQVLKHTNVLKKNDLEGTFVGLSYGAPLNEAALAGEVDVIFTADQPAAILLARGVDWVIIG